MTATVRVVEQALAATAEDDNSEVTVRRDGNHVKVTWFCNGSRLFSIPDLESSIANVEAVKSFPDVWLRDKDSSGSPFALRMVDGELFADDELVSDAAVESGLRVEWPALKKALTQAMA